MFILFTFIGPFLALTQLPQSCSAPLHASISTWEGDGRYSDNLAPTTSPSSLRVPLRRSPQIVPLTAMTTLVPRNGTDASGQECDFDSIEMFFEYAYREKLNITAEVQSCQNLCLMTYGRGNPDLSGIGMMHAYNLQTALTTLFGPIYRTFELLITRYGRVKEGSTGNLLMSKLQGIQTLFFASNGFFVLSSAVASLVRLSQNASIFEIAEMQALAFFQLNSLLVTFFCLTRPISRWLARALLTTVVSVCVIVVLAKSQLSNRRRMNWQQASIGCEHGSSDYGVIKPVPYPPSAVVVFAAAGVLGLFLRSVRASFQGRKRYIVLFNLLMAIWVLLIGLMTGAMILGVVMMWRQRNHLRSVVGKEFEDDRWGFGQVAALFIWAPVPVEVLLALNETAQQAFPKWDRLMNKELAHYIPWTTEQEDQSEVTGIVRTEKAHIRTENVTDQAGHAPPH